LELVLLVALIATNPSRFTRQTRLSRTVSLALTILVVGTNLVTLGLLIDDLVTAQDTTGGSLLIAAPAGMDHERDRVRVDLLGTRPRRPGVPHSDPPSGETAAR